MPKIPHSDWSARMCRRSSRYVAWCTLWKFPTPMCAIPALSAERSYLGTATVGELPSSTNLAIAISSPACLAAGLSLAHPHLLPWVFSAYALWPHPARGQTLVRPMSANSITIPTVVDARTISPRQDRSCPDDGRQVRPQVKTP